MRTQYDRAIGAQRYVRPCHRGTAVFDWKKTGAGKAYVTVQDDIDFLPAPVCKIIASLFDHSALSAFATWLSG